MLFVFLAPAFYNGSPFLFPDSLGYSRAGNASIVAFEALLDAGPEQQTQREAPTAPAQTASGPDRGNDGISTARSVYYGIPVALLHSLGGLWAIACAQAALTILVLLAGLRWFSAEATPLRNIVIVGISGLIGGLAIFTDTVMPDFLAGLLIFSVAIFLGFYTRMSPVERLGWLGVIAFSVLVHKGHVVVLAAIIGVAGLLALCLRRFSIRPYGFLAVLLLIALGGHATVDVVVTKLTGGAPVPTPFLLARVVGDGTALPYLDAVCPSKPYLLCRHRDRFPMTENTFLWSDGPGRGVVAHLDEAERRQLSAESRAIVIGAFLHDPVRQIRVTVANMARQNLAIGVTRYGTLSGLSPERAPEMASSVRGYETTAVAFNRMPLEFISKMMTAFYLLAVAGLALMVWRRPSTLFSGDDRAAALQLIVVGVLINACVFGAVSSTADRYQGRVAWLIPLMLMALLWRRRGADASHRP